MEQNAQGAIEYLLLIAGAVLVAAVVLAFLTYAIPGTRNTANQKLTHFLTHVG